MYIYPVNELGLRAIFSFCLRRQKKYITPMVTDMKTKGRITAAAITPPLTSDLFFAPPVALDVAELELEVPPEVVEAAELEDDVEVEVEEVVVGAADIESKFTPVNTTCSKKSDGWPLNVVSILVASDEAPHAHCK